MLTGLTSLSNVHQGGFASCYLISDEKNDRFAAKVIQKSELLSHKTRHKVRMHSRSIGLQGTEAWTEGIDGTDGTEKQQQPCYENILRNT
jgi:hypothetical protein